ncbi:hypothetical protein IAT38_000907 [Cryptococcus sp. DSM 104549]
MSRPPSAFPSSAPTPAPSSPPPPSESFLSELDGTAPSVLETSVGDSSWDVNKVDPTALNLVSWKLDVNARSEDGVEKRGFNAISTVLNHPTKRANPLRSSRKPLPPLTQPPPVLPKPPPPHHYDAYLKTITPLYGSFISAQHSQAAAQASTSGDGPSAPQRSNSDFDGRPAQKEAQTDLPPLDSVPAMFFDPGFDLSNSATWAELVGDGSSGEGDAAPGPEVHDALSTHLDTLERHLLHEITLRSTSFFSALSNLQDLHSESASCLTHINALQGSLKEVGEKQAAKGLKVIEEQEKLRVLKRTDKGVEAVGEVEEMKRVATRLVDEGDWEGGLGCVEDVVRWWGRYTVDESTTQGKEAELPLTTLPALDDLPSTLTTLVSSISNGLETALTSFLLSVFDRPGSDEGAPLDKEGLKATLEPMLAGIARCGKMEVIESVWREVVTVSIREGSRKHLPVGQGEDEGDGGDGRPPEARGANLAQSLQSMDHSTFLLLSAQMYGTLMSRLKLAQQIGEEVQTVAGTFSSLQPLTISSFTPSATPSSPTPPLDLSDVLTSGCELAHSRASKILAVRSEQNASLPLTEFIELFKENWEFILGTEALAKRMIISLRGVTSSQARNFLVNYHAVRLTKSAKLVEEEQWTQVDVPRDTQRSVDLIIEAAVSDPKECLVPPPDGEGAEHNGAANGNGEAGAALAKQLSIEDKYYFVVKATSESLVLLADYLKIVINLELVVTDVMSRIIEFLKSFNSRTCQVVLGAGAMRSAGLKNITAKHLALASQSLSVIVSLIPYIREFVRRHLSPKQAVMLTEFDKLKRDYQEHQNEIHAKLVAIMSDRLAVHCGSLREVDWEATPAKDGPRSYAEMLVKESATLHKVLSKYLAVSTVEGVMSEVIQAIVTRLGEEYTKVELKSDEAKKRMLQDVALITIRLKPLSESGKAISSLESLVREKSVPRKPIGQAVGGFLRRSNSQSKEGAAEAGEGVDEGGKKTQAEEGQGGEEEEDGAELTETAGKAEEQKDEAKEASGTATPVPATEPEPPSESQPEAPPTSSPPADKDVAQSVSGEPTASPPAEAAQEAPPTLPAKEDERSGSPPPPPVEKTEKTENAGGDVAPPATPSKE